MLSRVFFWLSIAFVVAAGAMYATWMILDVSHADFMTNAQRVDGSVIQKEIKQGKGISYYIHYQYDWQSQTYQENNRVERALYDSVQVDDSIQIVIDLEAPDTAQLLGEGVIIQSTLVFQILTIVFAALSAGFLIAAAILKLLNK